ncbi:hypothetical protein AVEN_179949-1 [Araneus ventricosus]|uniref:RNase H type-1 domain-containing protein n=1 Tax=Araneus ventricosus TaxID=182803 RepID=A0A4Y2TKL0_ARAVE|nr:hypothetical protein AVEN_179949-1 [Araneus ventricosus]
MESHSDHKYIYFNLELEDIPEADFFLKSKYGLGKFTRYVKKNLGYFKNKLAISSNIIYLNNLFSELIDLIKKAAFKTLKKKPKKFVKKYSFWNEDLRLARNKDNNSGETYSQAFSDDLALIIGGRTARELEKNTNVALAKIASCLDSLKLTLSIQKCQAVIYGSILSQKFSKRNSTVLNRKPTFRINNTTIKIIDSLKILGITIDNKLTWTAHINTLYDRTLFLTSNFNRIIKTDWSVNKNLIKFWYNTVIEKALLYGASVWGGTLNKFHIDRLHTIQRILFLKFARGYRTTSTNVLNVLTGIPPLHITAKAEFLKFQIWVRRSSDYNDIINNVQLDHNILIKNIPSDMKFVSLPEHLPDATYDVYTDESRINEETGLACAELAAIQFAANWAVSENAKINLFTDSLSSILALQSASSRSNFVNKAKNYLYKAKNLVASPG